MRIVTDFHIHSRYSRACSKELAIRNIAKTCERKGIQFVGTGDFTHPAWRKEIGEELVESSAGAFMLKDGSSPTRFLLSTELSCIYKRHGKTRRVHQIVLLSSLQGVDRLIETLSEKGFNLKSDGRPILGLDSEELVKMVFSCDESGLVIPAHIWTPWFAVFGSQSGFDSLEECFGEMTKQIFAVETGLSSDPKMNWRLSNLDQVFLVSNSDAHSLDKLGREANVFEMPEPSYQELRRILVEHDTSKFIETLEFFPEEGKYHADGHRVCEFWCEPAQTKKIKGMCPKCGKPLVIGVLNRVDTLADRDPDPLRPAGAVPFRSIIPLAEVIGEVFETSPQSKKVRREIDELIKDGRTEFAVLLSISLEDLSRITKPEIVEAIKRMREGKVSICPGYDGEFGVVSLLGDKASRLRAEQGKLF